MFVETTARATAADPGPSSAPAPDAGLAERPLELIEREIESLAARINAGCARWLELVGEFDRREGWAASGCRSTSEWVAWRCALNPRSAREHVRVARALRELPRTRAAFASGALSYSKARALTRVADARSEADLLELARHATAAQLERMVRAARRTSAAEAGELERSAFLRWSWDDDGSLRVEAKLAPADGAQFLRALESAGDALYDQRLGEAEELADDRARARKGRRTGACAEPLAASEPSGSAEPPHAVPRPRRPSNAESLVWMSEAALARPPTGLPGGERYQVIVHVDSETLSHDSPGASAAGPGTCAIADGPGISPETARRLACDASVVALVERGGMPLGVGRRSRTVPATMRRALLARDGRCQFPGCERRRFVDAHHIVHWSQGGETELDNLILLCRHHHTHVHEGGISIALEHGPPGARPRARFTRPDGVVIDPSPTAAPLPRNRRGPRALPPAGRPVASGSGEPMDLARCVDAVFAAAAPPGEEAHFS